MVTVTDCCTDATSSSKCNTGEVFEAIVMLCLVGVETRLSGGNHVNPGGTADEAELAVGVGLFAVDEIGIGRAQGNGRARNGTMMWIVDNSTDGG